MNALKGHAFSRRAATSTNDLFKAKKNGERLVDRSPLSPIRFAIAATLILAS